MRPVPYQSGRSARQVDRSLRQSLTAMDEARKCAVLWFSEVMRRGLYCEFGCSSIYQYATARLGFSRSKTRDFVHLAGKLEDLPAVKRAVADGELGYTKAREVVKVATPATEGVWLEAAQRPRRELVREVKRARRAARVNPAQGELVPAPAPVSREVPVRFSVEFTPEQEARRAALIERLHKLGGAPTDRAELLLEALAALVESREGPRGPRAEAGMGPRGPAAPVVIHVHERDDELTVTTDQGVRTFGPIDTERARCDAVICRRGRRAKSTIPPRVRREVLARDDHRCQGPGCGRTRFLEIHHRTPRSRGGTNDPANLITLCAACHRLHHGNGSFVRESAAKYLTRPPGTPRTDRGGVNRAQTGKTARTSRCRHVTGSTDFRDRRGQGMLVSPP